MILIARSLRPSLLKTHSTAVPRLCAQASPTHLECLDLAIVLVLHLKHLVGVLCVQHRQGTFTRGGQLVLQGGDLLTQAGGLLGTQPDGAAQLGVGVVEQGRERREGGRKCLRRASGDMLD